MIYELHVRDFSIGDATVPPRLPRQVPRLHASPTRTACGTCSALADAGVTDVHLLPVFDFATVPEQRLRHALRPPARPTASRSSRR